MKFPRKYQKDIVDNIVAELSQNARATVQMACGTGKTLVALWAAERLQAKTVVVFAPTLGLLAQLAREWLTNCAWPDVACLAVCSDRKLTEGLDEIRPAPEDCPFQVTGDSDVIRAYFDRPFHGVKLIFCTYQSSALLGIALGPKRKIDFGVFDEAHRATGLKDALFTYALENKRVAIRKRLFMTATLRNFTSSISSWQSSVYSMDREKDYGRLCAGLSFAEAVNEKIILPYRAIVSVINSLEVQPEELEDSMVRTETEQLDARSAAIRQSFLLALEKYHINKIITFHNTIAAAERFTKSHLAGYLPDYEKLHISSKMPVSERVRTLARFGAAPRAVLSNARCLTEGIDVPDVDMVAFMNPKSSETDVIQAMGRATRRAPGKETGYVFVPLFFDSNSGEKVNDAVERSDYTPVWQVLRALTAIDSRLSRDIEISRRSLGYGNEKELSGFAPLDFISANTIELERIRRGVTVMMLRSVGDVWDEHYGELQRFYHTHGHTKVPRDSHKQLASWLNEQRMQKRQGLLPPERVVALEALQVEWEPEKKRIQDAWNNRYQELQRYFEANGHCRVTSSQKKQLAEWVIQQRAKRRKGKLPEERIAALDAIHMDWEPSATQWNTRYQELRRFFAKNGPKVVARSQNEPLAAWLNEQRMQKRQGLLSPERIAALDALHIEWDPEKKRIQDAWNNRYQELQRFYHTHGHSHVTQGQNKQLSAWLKEQRMQKRRGTLSPERIAALEPLHVEWGAEKNADTGCMEYTLQGTPAPCSCQETQQGNTQSE